MTWMPREEEKKPRNEEYEEYKRFLYRNNLVKDSYMSEDELRLRKEEQEQEREEFMKKEAESGDKVPVLKFDYGDVSEEKPLPLKLDSDSGSTDPRFIDLRTIQPRFIDPRTIQPRFIDPRRFVFFKPADDPESDSVVRSDSESEDEIEEKQGARSDIPPAAAADDDDVSEEKLMHDKKRKSIVVSPAHNSMVDKKKTKVSALDRSTFDEIICSAYDRMRVSLLKQFKNMEEVSGPVRGIINEIVGASVWSGFNDLRASFDKHFKDNKLQVIVNSDGP